MNKPPFESLEQMAAAPAANLVQAAAGAAFHLFRDKNFRHLAGFDQLSQEEQDRIFNELLVGSLVLIMLVLEAPDLRMEDDQRAYLTGIGTRIPKAHIDSLRNLGIEAKHLRDWEKLIAMRYEEYARDRHGVRAAAMQLESAENDLDMAGLAKIQLCVPVQAVAIGCHDHICRGKTEGKDDLFRLLVRSLGRFYVELRVRLEVGKITWFTRMRVAVQRFFHRLRSKK